MTVIGQCPTECTYGDALVRFTVRCSLTEGHIGLHRGCAVIDFGLITLTARTPDHGLVDAEIVERDTTND